MKKPVAIVLILSLAVAAIIVRLSSSSDFNPAQIVREGASVIPETPTLVNRIHVDLNTTAASTRVVIPTTRKMLNSDASMRSGAGTVTVQNNVLILQSNNPGQMVSGQFDILLATDGISDDQWQLSKGSGQTASHVDVFNNNIEGHPTNIASADNVSVTGAPTTLAISGRNESLGGPLSIGSAGTKKVFAIYCPWWAANLSKWSVSYAIDNPVDLYTTLRQEDVNRLVNMASGAGIDGFLSSWQGKEHFAETAFQLLLNAAHQTPGFTAAIYLETGVANQGHTYAEPPDPVYVRQWITDTVQDHGSDPSYLKMNGKPVIFIYRARYFTPAVWKSQVFDPLRAAGIDAYYVGDYVSWDHVAPIAEYLAVFDGLHSYNPSAYLDNAPILFSKDSASIKTYSLFNDTSAPRKLWMGTTVPGFDNTHLYSPGWQAPRDNTNFYRFMWDANLANDPDWMLISTWNDYGENTYIEPSRNLGSTYLDVTRDYINGFKSNGGQEQPPAISDLSVEAFAPAGLEASWRTNEPSSTEIDYGATSGTYTGSLASAELKTDHHVAATGLQAGMYYARVRSVDASGTQQVSSEFSIVILSVAQAGANLSQQNVYWRDYVSYLDRRLTADFRIANTGAQSVKEVSFVGINASDGVTPGQYPAVIAEIPSGGTGLASIDFNVPAGVGSFQLAIRAEARLGDGTKVYLPAPPPF